MKNIVKNLIYNRIQSKLIIAILFFVVIPITIINTMYLQSSETIVKEQIKETDEKLLLLINSRIEAFIDEIVLASNTICFDKRIIEILSKSRQTGNGNNYLELVEMNEIITKAQNTVLTDIHSYISILDLGGKMVSLLSYSNDNGINQIKDDILIRSIIGKDGRTVWITPDKSKEGSVDTAFPRSLITLARLIKGSGEQEGYGILTISIEEGQFYQKVFSNINYSLDNENLFILSREGQIVTHTNRPLVGTYYSMTSLQEASAKAQSYFIEEDKNENKLVSYTIIDNTNWFLMKSCNYDKMFYELSVIRKKNLVFMLIVLFAFIAVTMLISYGITFPIKKLKRVIEKVEEGDLCVKTTFSGNDEVAMLGRSFNSMLSKINILIGNIKDEQKAKEELRLELMQAQINPHFIFNTLNTIKWTATINQAYNTAELIEDFGQIIGMSIKGIDKLITIEEEILNLQHYLNIQKTRFNYPVEEIIQIPEQLQLYQIPGLILQPIIENSIMHGFSNCYERTLNIWVSAYIENNKHLIIEVKDNGVGISKEKLEQILVDNHKSSHKNRFNRIGLQNVHRRIQLIFDDNYGLRINSCKGEGTTVKLYLPVIRKENSDAKGIDC